MLMTEQQPRGDHVLLISNVGLRCEKRMTTPLSLIRLFFLSRLYSHGPHLSIKQLPPSPFGFFPPPHTSPSPPATRQFTLYPSVTTAAATTTTRFPITHDILNDTTSLLGFPRGRRIVQTQDRQVRHRYVTPLYSPSMCPDLIAVRPSVNQNMPSIPRSKPSIMPSGANPRHRSIVHPTIARRNTAGSLSSCGG